MTFSAARFPKLHTKSLAFFRAGEEETGHDGRLDLQELACEKEMGQGYFPENSLVKRSAPSSNSSAERLQLRRAYVEEMAQKLQDRVRPGVLKTGRWCLRSCQFEYQKYPVIPGYQKYAVIPGYNKYAVFTS